MTLLSPSLPVYASARDTRTRTTEKKHKKNVFSGGGSDRIDKVKDNDPSRSVRLGIVESIPAIPSVMHSTSRMRTSRHLIDRVFVRAHCENHSVDIATVREHRVMLRTDLTVHSTFTANDWRTTSDSFRAARIEDLVRLHRCASCSHRRCLHCSDRILR